MYRLTESRRRHFSQVWESIDGTTPAVVRKTHEAHKLQAHMDQNCKVPYKETYKTEQGRRCLPLFEAVST